jgi:hypothetical protein
MIYYHDISLILTLPTSALVVAEWLSHKLTFWGIFAKGSQNSQTTTKGLLKSNY